MSLAAGMASSVYSSVVEVPRPQPLLFLRERSLSLSSISDGASRCPRLACPVSSLFPFFSLLQLLFSCVIASVYVCVRARAHLSLNYLRAGRAPQCTSPLPASSPLGRPFPCGPAFVRGSHGPPHAVHALGGRPAPRVARHPSRPGSEQGPAVAPTAHPPHPTTRGCCSPGRHACPPVPTPAPFSDPSPNRGAGGPLRCLLPVLCRGGRAPAVWHRGGPVSVHKRACGCCRRCRSHQGLLGEARGPWGPRPLGQWGRPPVCAIRGRCSRVGPAQQWRQCTHCRLQRWCWLQRWVRRGQPRGWPHHRVRLGVHHDCVWTRGPCVPAPICWVSCRCR